MSEVTREEQLLSAIATGENADFEPITRQEMFLAKMAGQSVETPEPITRVEKLYEQIILNGGAGGGGGEEPPTQTKSVIYNQNGIYFVRPDPEYYALDFVGITVNVPIPEYETWEGGSF